jgi:hypothetical protein
MIFILEFGVSPKKRLDTNFTNYHELEERVVMQFVLQLLWIAHFVQDFPSAVFFLALRGTSGERIRGEGLLKNNRQSLVRLRKPPFPNPLLHSMEERESVAGLPRWENS